MRKWLMTSVLFVFCGVVLAGPPDYLEYQDGKLVKIRCIICGRDVASVREAPSSKYPGKTFERLLIHPNYRNRKVILSDGSYTNVPFCAECNRDDTNMHRERITEQFKKGFELLAIAQGETPGNIEEIKTKYKNMRVIK